LYSFFNPGARWGGWSTPRPGRFTPGKDPVLGVQQAGWAPKPVWTGTENLASPPEFDPRTVQAVESLYNEYAIPYLCVREWVQKPIRGFV